METLETISQNWDKKEWLHNQESIIQTYHLFWTELENLWKTNDLLFRELKIWPLYNEWRPEETFKNREFKWELKDRLNSFKNRLIEQYPKHKKIINIYYNLFLAFGINPINISKEEELFGILSKKIDN